MGFNLDRPFQSGGVMPVTRPRPILGLCYQAATDRVAVHVLEFLDCLVMVPDIEIIIPSLPEVGLSLQLQLPRGLLLQHLQGHGQLFDRRLADQQMHMLGHEHISRNHQAVASAHLLQGVLEAGVSRLVVEQRPPSIATEGEEVKLPGVLVTDQLSRRGESSLTRMVKICDSHPCMFRDEA